MDLNIETRAPFLKKENFREDGDQNIVYCYGIEQKDGNWGPEFHMKVLSDNSGTLDNEATLSVWSSHLRGVAKKFKSKKSDDYVGKFYKVKAVEIVNAQGAQALGWSSLEHIETTPDLEKRFNIATVEVEKVA